jgi:hypothetical protein
MNSYKRKLEECVNKVKPEAAYFFEADGNRVAAFIFDMQTVDEMPFFEPLFVGMGANVELPSCNEPGEIHGRAETLPIYRKTTNPI